MVEHEYVECTSSAIQDLVLFKKLYPEHRMKEIEHFITNAIQYIENTQMLDGSWYVSILGSQYIHVCLTHYRKQITWLRNISTGMEIGEFASHMVPFLPLEAWQLLARLLAIVQPCAKQLVFYSRCSERTVAGERAIFHAQTR